MAGTALGGGARPSLVHFKFKSATGYDSVSFDGAFVSVGELKTLIAEKKGLDKDATSELLLSDPRTQAEYTDDSAVVPKSSSVLVRRVPNLQAAPGTRPGGPAPSGPPAGGLPGPPRLASQPAATGEDELGGEVFGEQRDEDAALNELLAQTGQQWEQEVRAGAARGRGRFGRGGFGGRGGRGREAAPAVLPRGYICYRCGQHGHHIADCPTAADPDAKRVRPAVGVPSVLLAKNADGGLLLPDGTTGTLQPNEDAFAKEMGLLPAAQPAAQQQADQQKPAEAPKPVEAPPASQPPPAVAPAAAASEQPDLSKAIVPVTSEAEPALAGELPFGGASLPLPGMGLAPWGTGGLPGLPLPGLADPLAPAPLSREEFARMKEQLRRKQQEAAGRRSRSRSRSRSRRGRDGRRERRRDSRSPRRHRRRRSSRDRSASRERRPLTAAPAARRRIPSPSFIQLRRRSRSPRPRRAAGSQSPPAAAAPAQQRRRASRSRSPDRPRPRRRETTRWRPEEDAVPPEAANGRPRASPAADLAEPQLMEDAPAAFLQPEAPQQRPPASRSRRPADLGASLSRLQRGVGSRWKAEEPAEAAAAAPDGSGGVDAAERPVEPTQEARRSDATEAAPAAGPQPPAAPEQGAGPGAEAQRRERKEKRAKEPKERREKRSHKRSRRSPEPPAAAQLAAAADEGKHANGSAAEQTAPAEGERESKKQRRAATPEAQTAADASQPAADGGDGQQQEAKSRRHKEGKAHRHKEKKERKESKKRHRDKS